MTERLRFHFLFFERRLSSYGPALAPSSGFQLAADPFCVLNRLPQLHKRMDLYLLVDKISFCFSGWTLTNTSSFTTDLILESQRWSNSDWKYREGTASLKLGWRERWTQGRVFFYCIFMPNYWSHFFFKEWSSCHLNFSFSMTFDVFSKIIWY